MSKTFWAQITGLGKGVLESQGEEVAVIYHEKKEKKERKKKFKDKKFLAQKKQEKIAQEEWLPDHSQGQLVVDIYEKDDFLVVESTIAGVSPQDIDITVEPDLIVIRGQRTKKDKGVSRQYYYQECFWGKFSRTLILPCPIKPDQVKASFKNGILTIFLPKAEETSKQIKIEQ